MRHSLLRTLIAGAVVVAATAAPARAEDLESVKKKIEVVEEYLKLGCTGYARKALAEVEKAAAGLSEFDKEKVASDIKSLQDSVQFESQKTADQYTKRMDRTIQTFVDQCTRAGADLDPKVMEAGFANLRQMFEDEENKKVLGTETCEKYARKFDYLKAEFRKSSLDEWAKRVDKYLDKIQEVLDGKTKTYTETVEQWFKLAADELAKLGDDERAKPRKERIASIRKTFDEGQAAGELSSTVDPVLEYWKQCKDDYGKDSQGWDQEKTPNSLQVWIKHSPCSIGCPKTEQLCGNVLNRWLESDNTKNALQKYPNHPPLKAAYEEATKLRETAGNKVCQFVNAILDEEDKLPPGSDREDAQRLLDEMKRVVTNAAKGMPAATKTIERIAALDARWKSEKSAGEAARAALDKKMVDATNAVWPEFQKKYASKVKKIDPTEALANMGSWKGTVIYFSGGARGVNLNRSGWNFEGDYDFVVEVDGVPVCGNYDGGLAEAVQAVEKQTTIDADNIEEVYGIVEGPCKVWERVQNPFDPNRYMRGRQLDAVKMRIVAVKACTIAACVGEGTNLQKLPEFKEVSVSESGSSSSSGGGHAGGGGGTGSFFSDNDRGTWLFFFKRLAAFFSSFVGVVAGAIALVHGAGKFVGSLPNLREKMGNGLGYAGAGITAFAGLWVVGRFVFMDLVPAGALLFTGAFLALEILRTKGTLSDDTAKTIQPAGILLGLATVGASLLHVILWDYPLL